MNGSVLEFPWPFTALLHWQPILWNFGHLTWKSIIFCYREKFKFLLEFKKFHVRLCFKISHDLVETLKGSFIHGFLKIHLLAIPKFHWFQRKFNSSVENSRLFGKTWQNFLYYKGSSKSWRLSWNTWQVSSFRSSNFLQNLGNFPGHFINILLVDFVVPRNWGGKIDTARF